MGVCVRCLWKLTVEHQHPQLVNIVITSGPFLCRHGGPPAPQCGPPVQGEDHRKYHQPRHTHFYNWDVPIKRHGTKSILYFIHFSYILVEGFLIPQTTMCRSVCVSHCIMSFGFLHVSFYFCLCAYSFCLACLLLPLCQLSTEKICEYRSWPRAASHSCVFTVPPLWHWSLCNARGKRLLDCIFHL